MHPIHACTYEHSPLGFLAATSQARLEEKARLDEEQKEALEAVVQRDEGKRGIRPLTHPGQLLSVATELLAVLRSAQDCVNVVVLTFVFQYSL